MLENGHLDERHSRCLEKFDGKLWKGLKDPSWDDILISVPQEDIDWMGA